MENNDFLTPAATSFEQVTMDITRVWEGIYKEWFGLEKNFSNLKISPKYSPLKHFGIIVAKSLIAREVVTPMMSKFKVSLYNDCLIAEDTFKDERTAEDGDYFIFFDRNIEACDEFPDSSALDMWFEFAETITFLERLLLEVLYFNETGKHLDNHSETICCGSRDVPEDYIAPSGMFSDGGYVPIVGWSSSRQEFTIHVKEHHCSAPFASPRVVVS